MKIIEFNESGTFQSYYRACDWLKENGYEYGSMQGDSNPIAIIKGDYNIPQKWGNIPPNIRKQVHGIMTSNDFREGSVKVTVYL